MSLPDPSPPRGDQKPDTDTESPGHRSGEGSASLHEHMRRDRDSKNEDESGRRVIEGDRQPQPAPSWRTPR